MRIMTGTRLATSTRRAERGAALGIVLVLMVVVLLGGSLAVWGVRSESGSAASDRLARQLVACAEQGMAWGRTHFSGAGLDWDPYL